MPEPDEPSQPGPGWRETFDRWSAWRSDLTEEAINLPKTLADLRQTITDLRQVSARLEGATEGLEMLLRRAESSGLAPMARRLDAAATEVESHLRDAQAQLPGGEIVTRALDELENAFRTFTSLWPEPKSKTKDP